MEGHAVAFLPQQSGSVIHARPQPDDAKRSNARHWIEKTNLSPAQRDAIEQREQDLRDLFPGREERKRRRGKLRRTRREDNAVFLDEIFRNAQQNHALALPPGRAFRWKPKKQNTSQRALATPLQGMSSGLARTLTTVVESLTAEANYRARRDQAVREALWFRASIVKVSFQRDLLTDAMTGTRLQDGQDNLARLNTLQDAYLRGEFQVHDAQFAEMARLSEAVGQSDEISVWEGINIDVIPLHMFACSGEVKIAEDLGRAEWTREDGYFTRGWVLDHCPYRVLAEENGAPSEWEGVHPDDLCAATVFDENGTALRRERDKQPSVMSHAWLQELVCVREVHDERARERRWYIPGVDYPVKVVKVPRTPQQFHPYYMLTINPGPELWDSRSDTELQADIQSRTHRKLSDEERNRFLAIPRGLINAANLGQKDFSLADIPPGACKVLSLPAQERMGDLIAWAAVPFNPEWYDVSNERLQMRMASRLAEQQTGQVGNARFASEAKIAAMASEISSSKVQERIDFWEEALLKAVAQHALQELSQEEVQAITDDPEAVWPEVVSEAEARKILQQMRMEEYQGLMLGALQGTAQLPADQRGLQLAVEQRVRERILEQYGMSEIPTREAIFRRLQVSFKAVANSRTDQLERFDKISSFIDAAGRAGAVFPSHVVAKMLALVLGDDDALIELAQPDAGQLAQQLAELLASGQGQIDPKIAQLLLQVLAQVMAQPGAGGVAGLLPSGASGEDMSRA